MVYRKILVIKEYVGVKELTMKGIATAGMVYCLKEGLDETGLGLKEFLLTESGEELMTRYGFESKFRVDNVIHKFKDLI